MTQLIEKTTTDYLIMKPSLQNNQMLEKEFCPTDLKRNASKKKKPNNLLYSHNKNNCGQTGNSDVRSQWGLSPSQFQEVTSASCVVALCIREAWWPLLSRAAWKQTQLTVVLKLKMMTGGSLDGELAWAQTDSFHVMVRLILLHDMSWACFV